MSTSKSKNAISHGVYSSDVVLPWENKQQFNDLHQALREEYYPDGVSEEAAVFEMASLHWKRRRLSIGTQLAFQGQPDIDALATAASDDGWEGVARYLKKISGDGDRICDGVRAVASSQLDALGSILSEISQSVKDESKNDPAVFEKLTSLANQINGVNTETIVPLLGMIEPYDLDQKIAERAYRPELMEKELKILAHIDRQIAKAMENLVRAKEYKKFYARQAIEGQSTRVAME